MTAVALFAIVCIISPSVLSFPSEGRHVFKRFPFVTREKWGGRPPNEVVRANTPVPFVVIHHTYIPGACFTFEECAESMRSMQDFHQLENGWEDIGYNFAVSSDGTVYEGRGWGVVGAHAFGYNSRSVGIALIGDWVSELPPQVQLDATKKLIQEGVELGYVSATHDLIGHRQVRATECPGDALFKEISTWARFQEDVPL